MSMRYATNGGSHKASSLRSLKCTDLPQFDALLAQADRFDTDDKLHLRYLCNDSARCAGLVTIYKSKQRITTSQGIQQPRKLILDYSRQRITGETVELLFDLADAMGLTERREALRRGCPVINATENRPVLHHVLRMPADYPLEIQSTDPNHHHHHHAVGGLSDLSSSAASSSFLGRADPPQLPQRRQSQPPPPQQQQQHHPSPHHRQQQHHHHHGSNHNNSDPFLSSSLSSTDGPELLHQVHRVREQVRDFSERLRSGRYPSITGQTFAHVVCIGGGCGPEFVAQALQADVEAAAACHERTLRFLNSVDPVDFHQATHDLDPARTLVIVISKSFSETETMLNARTAQDWLLQHLANTTNTNNTDTDHRIRDNSTQVVARHMIAVSNNPIRCSQFGISTANSFEYFPWICDRFSLFSVAGLLPLSLHYSYAVMSKCLAGAHEMDEHFFESPLNDNLPILLGLLGVWNSTFLGYDCRAVLPYSRALRGLPNYIQMIDTESNGKRVAADGSPLFHPAGEVDVGLTSGTTPHLHLFQMLHQGRAVPTDFIGFMESQRPVDLPGEAVSNHDELMSDFFAQPDALAYGKTLVDLVQEDAPEQLREHMVCQGNRPSSTLLFSRLDAFCLGQMVALLEHRTAVQGFLWGINSFDRPLGVEQGKTLSKKVRSQLAVSRKTGASVQGFNTSTSTLLEHYLSHGKLPKRRTTTTAAAATAAASVDAATTTSSLTTTPSTTTTRPIR